MMKTLLIVLLSVACAYLWVDALDARLEAKTLKKKVDDTPSCKQVAVTQCVNYWFTGDPADKALQRRRICGGKR